MKIYELEWYLYKEGEIKKVLLSSWQTAEDKYNAIAESLYNGCWISLSELSADSNDCFQQTDVLHYLDL